MKGFVEEWDQGRNHRDRSEERTANCRIPHFKSNSRINVKEYRCGDLFSAKGAASLEAWGIAPGHETEPSNSAEGASQGTD